MNDMRNIKRVGFALTLLAILGIGSCKKNHCYNCYTFLGYFKAFKNGDTVYPNVHSTTLLHDSISYYSNLGYTIDTVYSYTFSNPDVCDTNNISRLTLGPDSCVEII